MALFQLWETVTTGRVIDTFQNHFLKCIIHAAAGKNLAKAIDNHDLVRKRKEALLAAIGLLKEVRQKGIADNPNDKELIISEANKALDIASEKVDARVSEFNGIASQEIIEELQGIAEITDLSSLSAAVIDAERVFQGNLTKTTLAIKIESLKEAFGKIADLGIDAVRGVELHGSDYVEQAIRRLTHVLDIMNDDASDFAPELVRSDAIYKDKKWEPLLEHRNEVSDALRDHLSTLIDRQSSRAPV